MLVWAPELVLGRMAEETLLASTRVVPGQLSAVGYAFRPPDLHNTLSELTPKDVRRISEG
jgi:NAD dependent epimerase/dehydratase family enzyme